jgi:CBS domain-containing protein/uncharacterized protein (DUF2267 family)
MIAVRDFVPHRPVVLSETATVGEAACAMRSNGIGTIVAASPDEGVTGILTDRDIACYVLAEKRTAETPIASVMSKEVVSVDEDEPVENAVRLMIQAGVRRLPVIRADNRCVGLVSIDDLIVSGRLATEEIADVIRSQLRSGARRRAARERSAKRSEATATEFLTVLGKHMEIDRAEARRFALALLSPILRRIVYSEAAHFLSEMPRELQQELDEVAAGPDASITAGTVVQEVREKTGLDEETIRRRAPRLWQGLERHLHEDSSAKGELFHVLSQLPKDIQELLGVKL